MESFAVESKNVVLASLIVYGGARHYQDSSPLKHQYGYFYIDIGKQFQVFVVDGAENLTHAAHAMRNNLLGNLLRNTGPGAAGLGVPRDLNALVRAESAQIRFVDKSTNTNVTQIGHFGEHIPHFDEIAGANG